MFFNQVVWEQYKSIFVDEVNFTMRINSVKAKFDMSETGGPKPTDLSI